MSDNVIASAAYKQAASVFSILSHPVSLHILTLLNEYSGKETCTARFMSNSKVPLSAVQYRLTKLIALGVVRRESIKTEVYYKLAHGRIETINSAAARLL